MPTYWSIRLNYLWPREIVRFNSTKVQCTCLLHSEEKNAFLTTETMSGISNLDIRSIQALNIKLIMIEYDNEFRNSYSNIVISINKVCGVHI